MATPYQAPPILTKPPPVPVNKAPTDCQLIIFQLETTDLVIETAEILQISVFAPSVDAQPTFINVLPSGDVHHKATAVNGLSTGETHDGQKVLTRDGMKRVIVNAPQGAIAEFLRYLKEVHHISGKSVAFLVAQSAKKFHAPILVRAIYKFGIPQQDIGFPSIVFADSLTLFQEKKSEIMKRYNEPHTISLSLLELYKTVFKQEYPAEDPTRKLKALYDILFALNYGIESLLPHAFTYESLYSQLEFEEKEKTPRLQTLKGTIAPYTSKDRTGPNQISYEMAKRCAESGLNLHDFISAYQSHGEAGVAFLLTEKKEDGKPRVTNDKGVLYKIVAYLQDEHQMECN